MSGGWGISYEIALRWMPLEFTDGKWTLVQVMAWCRQATSHYLSQCWTRSMSPNGVNRPQWIRRISFQNEIPDFATVAWPPMRPLQMVLTPPSAAYMRQWTGSPLVQLIACGLLGTNLSPETMLPYCQLNLWEKNQWNLHGNSIIFILNMYLKMSSAKMAAILSRRMS